MNQIGVMKTASNFNEKKKFSGFLSIKLFSFSVLFPAKTFVKNFIHNVAQALPMI